MVCNVYKQDKGDKEMTNEELLKKAKEGLSKAYTPYSNFQVGAALLSEEGKVFVGCNIENASYGATICAERTAMVKAISEGYTKFSKIAVVSNGGAYTYPCGICRQFMSEFMLDGKVILEDKEKGILEHSLSDLLPAAFTRKDVFNE